MTDNLQHQVVADLRARIAELEKDRDEARNSTVAIMRMFQQAKEAAIAGKTQFCQQCEKTERELRDVSRLLANGPPNSSCDIFATLFEMHGLWRAPKPATPTDTQGGE